MTNMNSAEFINAIDHAAGMNDRWLFLAAFCLLLLVCGLVIYWLVQQLQAVIADHKALRDEHHAALTQIIEKQNETAISWPCVLTAIRKRFRNARLNCGDFRKENNL